MSTIRTSIARLGVASALVVGLGVVGAAPALAGTWAWAGRAAPTTTEDGAGGGAAIESSHHGIDGAHDAHPGPRAPDGQINAI